MTTQTATRKRTKKDPNAPDPRTLSAVVHRVGTDPFRYEILSHSQAALDVWYTLVHQPDDTLSCECPGGSHGRVCWHIITVRPYLVRDLRAKTAEGVREIEGWGFDVPRLSAARRATALLQMSSDDGLVFSAVGVV